MSKPDDQTIRVFLERVVVITDRIETVLAGEDRGLCLIALATMIAVQLNDEKHHGPHVAELCDRLNDMIVGMGRAAMETEDAT